MTVKVCKTSKQIMVQLLQTGTDEKPSSKTVSQVLLIFYNSINDKQCLIWNYAVKVRRRELEVTNFRPRGDSENLNRLESSDIYKYSGYRVSDYCVPTNSE
jgi:hypothetical protein